MTTNYLYVIRSYNEPLDPKAAIAACPYVEATIVRAKDLVDSAAEQMKAAYIYVTKLTRFIIDGRIIKEECETTRIKGKIKMLKKTFGEAKRPGLKNYDPQLTPLCVSNALATAQTNQERLCVALELIQDNEKRSQALGRANNLYLISEDYRRFMSSSTKVIYFPLSTSDKDITYLAVSKPDLSPVVSRVLSLSLRVARQFDMLALQLIDELRTFLINVKKRYRLGQYSIRQKYCF